MSTEFVEHKLQLVTSLLLLSYAYPHFRLTVQFTPAALPVLLNFDAPLPYGQRVLMPALGNVLSKIFSLDAANSFFLLEWGCAMLLYVSMKKLLEVEFTASEARVLSWLFLILLPLSTLISYHYSGKMPRAFFFHGIRPRFFLPLQDFSCV